MKPEYPFTEEQARKAYEDWGANCGPNALAVCLGVTLDEIRPAMERVGFAERRYTSPTMMQRAIYHAGGEITRKTRGTDFAPWSVHGLVRIQWHGPWTAPGANPKWAYRQTHWVHSMLWPEGGGTWVFDCNGGWMPVDEWERTVVPAIVATIPRANGEFSSTHVWGVSRLQKPGAN